MGSPRGSRLPAAHSAAHTSVPGSVQKHCSSWSSAVTGISLAKHLEREFLGRTGGFRDLLESRTPAGHRLLRQVRPSLRALLEAGTAQSALRCCHEHECVPNRLCVLEPTQGSRDQEAEPSFQEREGRDWARQGPLQVTHVHSGRASSGIPCATKTVSQGGAPKGN